LLAGIRADGAAPATFPEAMPPVVCEPKLTMQSRDSSVVRRTVAGAARLMPNVADRQLASRLTVKE
jgi:hypothetical protein